MQNRPAYITLRIFITAAPAILAVNGVSMGEKLSQRLIFIGQKEKGPGFARDEESLTEWVGGGDR